jgi:hypothetical protein
MFGNTGGQILQFAFGVVLARLLVPADFGMIAPLQCLPVSAACSRRADGTVPIRARSDRWWLRHRSPAASSPDHLLYGGSRLPPGSYLENPLYQDLLRVSALIFIRPSRYCGSPG